MRRHLWILVVGLLAGCGSPAPDKAPQTQTPAAQSGPKRVAVKNLPKLAAALDPLDGGRITNVAPPEGWTALDASDDFIAGFALDKASGDPPRILLSVEEAPTKFIADVNAKNVETFAKSVATELKDVPLVEAVRPMIIGNNAFARYVTAGKLGERDIERQLLATQFAGRRYVVALEVLPGEEELLKHRDSAYAVAAGLSFPKPGAAK